MKKAMVILITAMIMLAQINAFAIADTAECACLINAATGDVIFSKNAAKQHSMASTTKIMTAIVAIERCKMDEVVTVSANAEVQEGSAAYVKQGNQLYMKDMLYGLMLNSGNDAAVAIAEHIGGSVEGFARLMNDKAVELGLRNTHFVNPSGLDDPEHYTTASDLALMARYAMTLPQFREIVQEQTAQAKPINSEEILYFSNHNKMLGLYEGATGVKTGYTKATGRCLVSSAKRNSMEFIAVTLGDSDDWNSHMQLLDYAFSSHYPKTVVEAGMKVKIAEIDGKKYSMTAADDFVVPFKNNQKESVNVVYHVANDLKSPINAGEKVGVIEIKYGDMTVGTVDIISESEIRGVSNIRLKNSFFNNFIHISKMLLV